MIGRLFRRYVAPVAVVSAFYFGLLVYPVLRIWYLLLPPPGTATLLVIMVGPLLLRMAAEVFPGTVGRSLSAIALTWLGVCFLAFTVVFCWEFVHLVLPLTPTLWGLLLCLIVAALALYASSNAHRLITADVDIQIPAQVPQSVAGLRLAQISDLHIGSRQPGFLHRVVVRVNEAQPDYVLITGDLIDFRGITEAELASLGTFNAPASFIIGNHERYVDVEDICQRLRNLGITVLRNDSIVVDDLQIIGIDDADARDQVPNHLNNLQPLADKYRILLYHRPDGAEAADAWGAHLMLCGHTHNGQILPFNLLVRRIFPRILGRYQVGQMILYVSPGTGTWGPVLRLGSRCEISMICLQASANSRG
jgi:predicted MPP superfamily phosphohydrolase